MLDVGGTSGYWQAMLAPPRLPRADDPELDVTEHVGGWDDQRAMAEEIRRVSRQ
jgi:hypothetical protein